MTVQLSEIQNSLIKKIVKNEGIEEYNIEATAGSIKGDNYLGIITSIKVESKDKEKVLNLILKSSQRSEKLREQFPIQEAFEREVFCYNVIFPAFFKFQKQFNIQNPFCGFAKIYGYDLSENNECLVMENIKENNYKLWNRKLPMNSAHIEKVMMEYGKLHSVSFAMKKLQPELYNELTSDLSDIFEKRTLFNDEQKNKMYDGVIENACDAVRHNEKLLLTLREFRKIIADFFENVVLPEDEYFIITHGDCWNNNIMFNYGESTSQKPTKVCLIDWQLCKKGNPVFDLSYFFYTAADTENLEQFDTYLRIYHNALSENLRKFGMNPDEIYSWGTLNDHWKKYAKFGIYIAFIIIKAMYGDSDDLPNLEEVADSGKDLLSGFTSVSSGEEAYKNRIYNLVSFNVGRGFL